MGDHIESEMDLAHPEIKHLDGHGAYSTCSQFGDIAEEEAADAYDALSDEVLELREEVGALRRSVLEAYMELRSAVALQCTGVLLGEWRGPGAHAAGAVGSSPNTPPQLVNQIWAQVAQAVNDMAQRVVEVAYSLVNALIESRQIARKFRTSGAFGEGWQQPTSMVVPGWFFNSLLGC